MIIATFLAFRSRLFLEYFSTLCRSTGNTVRSMANSFYLKDRMGLNFRYKIIGVSRNTQYKDANNITVESQLHTWNS